MEFDIYKDIAIRSGGDVYVGVVGPVRTGKSTFIKRFMEELIIDNITDKNERMRAIDELPQSADGKTVMTTEPKFVPNVAVKMDIKGVNASIRMIDCVGYKVDEAIVGGEDGNERMVHTPWSDEEMPFEVAGEIGTRKVITEHSTVGIIVTQDGSITDISRNSYEKSELRVVEELKAIGKPYVIVLNTKYPKDTDTVILANELSQTYNSVVVPMDVKNATKAEFSKLLYKLVMEFPIKRVDIMLPKWVESLGKDNKILDEVYHNIQKGPLALKRMSDIEKASCFDNISEFLEHSPIIEIDASVGVVKVEYKEKQGVFYKILSEATSENITSKSELMSYVINMSVLKNKYERIRVAMDNLDENGYGIVTPILEETELNEPEIIKRGAQFGVKLKAKAPSIHLMKVDVEAEISPLIGSEQQSVDTAKSLMANFENNKNEIWDTNMFGRPLSSMVCDDINAKIYNMPKDTQKKIRKTVGRIINENRGGVLCILL